MIKTVDFIFDFGSPNAYMAHKVLPKIAQRTKAKINYIPCLLGGIFKATNNRSPFLASAGIKGRQAYEKIDMTRYAIQFGLTKLKMNPHFPVNTILLMRGAVAAEQKGQLKAYMNAGFAGMWEQGKKMDEEAVFIEHFNAAGLDAKALIAESQKDAVKEVLRNNTAQAVERGVFGAPTFFVGDDMYFGKDRLYQVENRLRSPLKHAFINRFILKQKRKG